MLILVASFERRLLCLIHRKLLRSPARRWLARSLGVIPYGSRVEGWQSGLEACRDVLGHQGVVAVFAQALGPEEASQLAAATANIATEADSEPLGIAVVPVHLWLPGAGSGSAEALIHLGAPVLDLSPGSALPERVPALTAVLDGECRQIPFGLRPESMEQFLADLAEVSRSDLEEEWALRPNWNQKIAGFKLSEFTAEWVEHVNRTDPGRLVALRVFLDRYRERRRRYSLRQLQIEMAPESLKSAWLRAGAWVETAVGFPLACYGLINHLAAGLLLFSSGLLKVGARLKWQAKWLARAVIVLVSYAVQISLVAYFLGRSAAGYYAVTLPLSGAYLWRYGWLLRHRTKLLLLSFGPPTEAAELRRMRKELLEKFNMARDIYADLIGVAH